MARQPSRPRPHQLLVLVLIIALKCLVVTAVRLHFILCQDVGCPRSANKYLALWASPTAYLAECVLPVLGDSWSVQNLQYIGFLGSVPPVPVPLFDEGLIDGDVTEEQDLLTLHFRLFLSHVANLMLFSVLHQSPPWQWVLYLAGGGSTRRQVLDRMQAFWELVLRLEASADPLEQSFSKLLQFKD